MAASTIARSMVPSNLFGIARGCTPPRVEIPPCSYTVMWLSAPRITSLPRTCSHICMFVIVFTTNQMPQDTLKVHRWALQKLYLRSYIFRYISFLTIWSALVDKFANKVDGAKTNNLKSCTLSTLYFENARHLKIRLSYCFWVWDKTLELW